MDGAWRFRRDVRRDTAGEGELPEQSANALGVLRDVGVGLGVGAVEIGTGDQAGPPWPGPVTKMVGWLRSAIARLRWA